MIPEAGLLPDYPTTIRCRASPGLFGHYPKPGFARTVWPLYEVGLLPDCPNDSRTIWLLSEVGLSVTPETAQGLSAKARTYLYDNYNTNVRKDKLSPHTHTLLIPTHMTRSEHALWIYLPDCSATIRSQASPGLFGHNTKSGFSRTVRMTPGRSGYSPKSGFPSLPRLRKAFLRRQERIYMIITILTYGKTSSLHTHTHS